MKNKYPEWPCLISIRVVTKMRRFFSETLSFDSSMFIEEELGLVPNGADETPYHTHHHPRGILTIKQSRLKCSIHLFFYKPSICKRV
jgi:hypothetical protein